MKKNIDVAIRIINDSRQAEIKFIDNSSGNPTHEIFCDADQLEKILHILSNTRTKLKPPVVKKLPETSKLFGPKNPIWVIRPSSEATLLNVRHPGFGWLSFAIPHDISQKLGEALLRSSGRTIQRH